MKNQKSLENIIVHQSDACNQSYPNLINIQYF